MPRDTVCRRRKARLRAFGRMAVGEHFRAVPVKHEQIRMPAERERGFGGLAQLLADGAEPRTRTLPGIVVAVELIGAERAVRVGQGQGGGAQRGSRAGDGGEREVAVVAVRREAA